ncbi:hypothetical protein CVT26_002532 [Gymnopilus dilepis]|uniref:CBM1 domain-containing protein n=1 Tax=Gymnopilus dilepis TaxID=231916 RepID=A0A409VT01_9AGAR|nr:hypothetical protein CVT26_002532 [Gymnopilus dilepis]
MKLSALIFATALAFVSQAFATPTPQDTPPVRHCEWWYSGSTMSQRIPLLRTSVSHFGRNLLLRGNRRLPSLIAALSDRYPSSSFTGKESSLHKRDGKALPSFNPAWKLTAMNISAFVLATALVFVSQAFANPTPQGTPPVRHCEYFNRAGTLVKHPDLLCPTGYRCCGPFSASMGGT